MAASKNTKKSTNSRGSGSRATGAKKSGSHPASKTAKNASANKQPQKKKVREEIDEEEDDEVKDHKLLKSVIPYLMMFLGFLIAICFIAVRLFDAEDGAGAVGKAIDWMCCGLLGFSALAIPIALFYIGLKWCLYNIKVREAEEEDDDEFWDEVDATRKRNVLQTVMISLLLLFVAALGAVFADGGYDLSEIGDMFVDSAEDDLFVGGIFGGALAVLMTVAFNKLISIIILIIAIAVTATLTVGITPDRIVVYFRNRAEKNKVRRQKERLARQKEREEMEKAAEEEEKSARLSRIEERALAERKRNARPTLSDDPGKYEDVDEDVEFEDVDAEDTDDAKVKIKPAKKDESDDGNEVDEGAVKDKETADDANQGSKLQIKKSDDERDLADEILEEMAADKKDKSTDAASDGKTPSSGVIDLNASDTKEGTELKKTDDTKEGDQETAKDYGGDPVFDNPDFKGMLGLMRDLKHYDDSENADGEEDALDMSEMSKDELFSDVAAVAPDENGEVVEVVTPYVFPPIDMLAENKNPTNTDFSEELQENARILMDTLKSFKVSIKEITYSRGPTITRYELKPDVGTRVRQIANLVDDIALNLATSGVRIEAPIPNKPAVGIEVPNRDRATVYLRDLIESSKFVDAKSRLTSSLGMDVGGNPIYFDIAKMPHLLIAGATGMGKSVCINSIIVSILYKAKPDEVKLILIDPKKVEFNIYKDIPHLYAPIVSDPKKAAGALASAVAEMERRFELIEEVGVRDIATYNSVTENDPDKEFMPQMVIIIDELADLMMTAPDEVEASICRLAQKARAAGIHIVIGTQRPSVDVITGLIKANIPSRIACTVASQIDSRTILDMAGAEKLIGRGDMLFAPVGSAKPMRVQGAFVSEAEVEKIVTFIKENNSKAMYNSEFINKIEEEAAKCGIGKKGASVGGGGDSDGAPSGGDSKFGEAVKLAIEEGKISTSLMQRRLGLGYGRAAKIIDTMEQMGYVSKPDGNKPRRVIITMDQYIKLTENDMLGGDDL